MRAMGVTVDRPAPGRVVIDGVGLHGLTAPARPLDMGNAGTAMRLSMGLLAGQAFDCDADRRCVAVEAADGARRGAAAADGRRRSRPATATRR